MNPITSGYENKPVEGKDLPSPSIREWIVDIDRVGQADEGEIIYAVIKLDSLVIGMVRLPNADHLKEFRRRVQCLTERTPGQ